MEKQKLKKICSEISELIEKTNNSNVYDNIITFFQLTSNLHDRITEIQAIPIATKTPAWTQRLFKRKEAKRTDQLIQNQERQKQALCRSITNAGRCEHGYNQTKPGEEITKNNIYFGGISKLIFLTVAEWEKTKNRDPKVYNKIGSQMTNFMKSFKDSFKLTDWL